MIIGIDGNEANNVRPDIGERVGVNRYGFEILWGLFKENKKQKNKHKFVVFLKNKPAIDLPKEDTYWKYEVISGGGLWIIRRLMPTLLKNPRPDVFFTPSHYLPPLLLAPGVCTIHDLGYLKFSEHLKKYDFWQLKYWTAISITISKYIISISESTKGDIVRHYHKSSKKVSVVYHGYEKSKFNTKISKNDVRRVKKKYGILSGEYILFLSTLKPSKNVEGLLKALTHIKPELIDGLTLVVAGKKGWLYDTIFQKYKDLKLGKKVVFTDFVRENDKANLIYGAKVFVLPSYWEGFGMDVVHAMACGTPVVVSRVASLPEVAGNAGVYVNPNKPQSIAKGIEKVLNMDKIEYNKLVKIGLRQAEKFSWEKAARQTLAVLEKAARIK
ncbi:MAG: glycosyltransferase family 4 protein [Patescibacteria group bacterium]